MDITKCIICSEGNYAICCFACKVILCRKCLDTYNHIDSTNKCRKENYGYCPYMFNDFDKWRNNWESLFVTWFCTENCMINFIIDQCTIRKINYFELESKPDGVEELCNRQHNIWLKMVMNDQDVLIRDLLNIVYEYAQK